MRTQTLSFDVTEQYFGRAPLPLYGFLFLHSGLLHSVKSKSLEPSNVTMRSFAGMLAPLTCTMHSLLPKLKSKGQPLRLLPRFVVRWGVHRPQAQQWGNKVVFCHPRRWGIAVCQGKFKSTVSVNGENENRVHGCSEPGWV